MEANHIGTFDVGYGVSQVLPVIVGPMFLLQQPEVHRSSQRPGKACFVRPPVLRQLIVSDHLLDRVRMDVRDGSVC